MATSAFKSTTKRPSITTSSPSTDDSPTSSSSSYPNRRSRSVSRFSRPVSTEIESDIAPTSSRNFVNSSRGSEFPEISLGDLAIEFFSNGSEFDDESVSCSRSSRRDREVTSAVNQRRSRSVSRCRNGGNSVDSGCGGGVDLSSQRRGRSVSRRNNGDVTGFNGGGAARVVSNADARRRRSVSVARRHISDSESDIDFSRSSASQTKSRSTNKGNNQAASYQRPTASSHRRLTRSMSQAPQLRSHDGYLSQSSALTDDDLRDTTFGRNGIEKTIRAVHAHKKSEKRQQDLSTEDQRAQDGYKIIREVVPKSKGNTKSQTVPYTRKRSNDRSRMSKRLSEEAEKYLEDFISNIEDTDFSSFDGERSDTSSTLAGSITKQNCIPVEMEGVNLPWLKWDNNDGVRPTTPPKTKMWDPSQDLELIQERVNGYSSSHGSWNPEHTPANSTNTNANKFNKIKSPRFDMGKYSDIERTEEVFFDSWRERSVIRSGGLLLCPFLIPY